MWKVFELLVTVKSSRYVLFMQQVPGPKAPLRSRQKAAQ